VPLLELTDAQFVLVSATLGDVTELAADLTRRNGRETAVVDKAERPVPLHFSWSLEPLGETLTELVETGQAPVYVVHFTQAAAVEQATGCSRVVVSRQTLRAFLIHRTDMFCQKRTNRSAACPRVQHAEPSLKTFSGVHPNDRANPNPSRMAAA
jgi:hypothetical protein